MDEVIVMDNIPTSVDQANLIAELPEEKVDIDKNGHYDPAKSPNFHDWMVNG